MVKKRWVGNSVVILLLALFFFREIIVDTFFPLGTWTRTSSSTDPSLLIQRSAALPVAPVPLRQAFAGRTLNVSDRVLELAPPGIRTEFEENRNVDGYGLTVVRNACFLPGGEIVLVNITDEYLNQTLSASPKLQELWSAGYNSTCGWCQKTGSQLSPEAPEGARWIPGNTTHILPYLGNVFHNFAERIWPHLASHHPPLNQTAMQPINHFLIHKFTTWIEQADAGNHERENFMLQFRVLAELSPGSDFVVMDSAGQNHPVCFERITLSCSSCDRMSTTLGHQVFSASITSYREAAFKFFGVPEPAVSAPPRPLRVAFYGRSDTRRRRVANAGEVMEHLRAWDSPPLDILFLDELLSDKRYNQTMPEAVALFSHTDVLVTVHGANTWATMFMPRRAAVIEIYGPCGPGTWIDNVARALDLKHDTTSNPWRDKVASPLAGNTTQCEGAIQTPDFTLDTIKLDEAIAKLALPTGPLDRIPLHWLYDWKKRAYATHLVEG
ncbi:hypothetical protein SELMODRAFT_444031 [Selaginella moellendorffii]|uniref:Glycosyltransferase 61 catalytic domain-containing protein n=1 Tax=Selaginella moellendorffii TaxID=88036 RepID=D8S6R6_SELML|nr:hypothetical protein SELMODRAFT_444031 [Selaginella moellendorffii]